jgi:hypothetical protein
MNEDFSVPRAMAVPPVEKSIRLDPSIADRVSMAVANRKPVPAHVAARRQQNNQARLSKGDPIG